MKRGDLLSFELLLFAAALKSLVVGLHFGPERPQGVSVSG